MDIPLHAVVTRWACPNCDVTDVTRGPVPNRYHTCAGLHMLSAPLVPEGTRAKVEAEERADYLNGDLQAAGDDGRPYMAVRVTREDGEDLTVNAGLARARLSDCRLPVRAGQPRGEGDDPVGNGDGVTSPEFM
jgi:hypothetical protein